MNRKWIQRLLCAIICLALLLADVPAGLDRAVADDAEMIAVEEAVSEETPSGAPDAEVVAEPDVDSPPPDAEDAPDPLPSDEPEDAASEDPEIPEGEADPQGEAEPEDAISGWIEALNAQALPDDYSRALWLYDLVLASFEPGDAQDATSALADGSAAPLGYALTYQELLDAAGIECLTVTGADSTWNLARLDGDWAHIDTYADDAPDCYGTHFGLSDAAMSRDHRWDGDYPACGDLSNSYFVRERGYAAYVDIDELRALLADAISSGAQELYLLNASEQSSVEEAVTALLAELDSNLAAAVSEKGCYAAVHLEEIEDSAPDLVAPEATAPALIAPEPEAPELVVEEEQTEVAEEPTEVASEVATIDAIAATALDAAEASATGTITTSVESLTLGVGETAKIDYTLDSESTDTVHFTSKYEKIATVGETSGEVTAVKVGRTTITLTAEPSGASCEVEIVVKEKPTGIALSLADGAETHRIEDNTLVLGQNDTVVLQAAVEPKSAAGAITWETSPADIGVPDPKSGTLTISVSDVASEVTSFTVTAKTYEYEGSIPSKTITVCVVAAPEDDDLKISLDKTVLGIGQEIDPQFGYSDTYSEANDNKIAPYSFSVEGKNGKYDIFARDAATGKYVAKYAGTATVRMTAYNGAHASETVTVMAAPTGVSVKLPMNTLRLGETFLLPSATAITVSGKNAYTGDVTLYSKNEDIVHVEPTDGGWNLIAEKTGTAKLYARTYNGKQSKDVSIAVSDVPTELLLNQTEDVTLAQGEKIKLKATLQPKGRSATVTWSCVPENAFIYKAKTGEWTAVGEPGDAKIIAALPNGTSKEVTVHLKRAVTDPSNFQIAFVDEAQKKAIGIGETTKLEVQFADEDGKFEGEPVYGGAISWSVDSTTKKKGYATVKNGVVTAKKAGTAVIIAKVNGIQHTQTIPILSKPVIAFDPAAKSISMAAGETLTLKAHISSGYAHAEVPSPDKSNLISFRSSNAKVVNIVKTISTDGDDASVEIEALPDAVGKSAKIYARPVGGKEIALSVAVSPALESIALAKEDVSLAAGESMTLRPTLVPANAKPNLKWEIEPVGGASEDDVTIDARSGVITAGASAVPETKYTVTVTAEGCEGADDDSLSDSCKVTIKNLPTSSSAMQIAVEKQVGSFDAGSVTGPVTIGVNEKLNGSVVYTDGNTAGSVTWSSDNTKYVKVDAASGVITGVKAGTANITATSLNGLASASIQITVCSKPSAISFSKSVAVLGVNESFSFEVKPNYKGEGSWYTLHSDNSQILQVAQDGKVKAVKAGVASVIATSYTGSKKSVKVTVLPEPEALNIPASVKLARGDKLRVRADFGGGYANLDWATGAPDGTAGITVTKKSNEEIEISATAEATATSNSFEIEIRANGYAGTSKESSTVTVQLVDGYSSSDEMGEIALGKDAIGVGESTQASVTPKSDASTGGSFTWSSSNKKIAKVSSAGVVKGVRAGTAMIYATAFNSKKNAVIRIEKPITVVAAPSLTFDGKKKTSMSLKLGLNETWKIKLQRKGYDATVTDRSGLYQPVAIGNDAIVEADGSDLNASDTLSLKGLAAGTTTVTVKTYNNKSVKLTVTVVENELKGIQISNLSLEDDFTLKQGFLLAQGDSVTPAVKLDPEGSFANLTWDIDPADSGLSEAGGIITAAKDATVGKEFEVTAKSFVGTEEISCSFNVKIANAPSAENLPTVKLPKAKIAVGETIPATISFPEENTTGTMKWASSGSKYAKVSPATGTSTSVIGVRTNSKGVTITATAFNNKYYKDTEKVSVVAAPTSIDFKQGDALGVFPGESYDLDVRLPEGYLGDLLPKDQEEQETLFHFQIVNNDGEIIKALDEHSGVIEIAGTDEAAPGETATISVTTCDGKHSDVLTLTALAEPDTVTLFNGEEDLETLEIAQGERFMPTVRVEGSGKVLPDAGVQWSVTGNPEGDPYVRIDPATGELTALRETDGALVTVTATAKSKSDSYTVTICSAPTVDSLLLAADPQTPVDAVNIILGAGETTQVTFRFADDVAGKIYNKKVTFRGSKNQKYAGIVSTVENSDGSYTLTVKGKKAGSEAIIARTAGGLEKSLSFKVVKAPSKVTLSLDRTVLGVGERMALTCALPKGSSSAITYSVSDEGVARVEEKKNERDEVVGGYELVALTTGKTELTATTFNNKRSVVTIEVLNAPESIEVSDVKMGVGARAKLRASVNEGSAGKLEYELLENDSGQTQTEIDAIATIDEQGYITAKKEGTLKIHVSTYVEDLDKTVTLEVVPAPTAISFTKANYAIEIGETDPKALQLETVLTPDTSAATLTYSYKNKSYFTIDEDGYVKPLAQKEVSQDVTVKTHNFISTKKTPLLTAKTKVWVVKDLRVPKIIRLAESAPVYVKEGDSYKPELYIFPEEAADSLMTWTSSDASIASVNPKTGEITGESFGFVTITGTSIANSKLSVSFKLIVLSDRRCLKMPEHRIEGATALENGKLKSRIDANLDQIEKVHQSAIMELTQLVADGVLTETEKDTRKAFIDKAFGMFSIPWKPNKLVGYWKAANSVGGRKNFNTTTVYFGLPYTQTHRKYDLGSFLAYCSDITEGGYRIARLASRNYPGNDCSSFVSMAIWGGHDTTSAIATNGRYTTRSNWYDLRPGDLICKGGSHVVMFLYYVNKACDQFVVIEQGGGGDDPYSNCVSTSLRTQSYYKNRKYKIRRLKGLDTTTHDRRDYM